MRHLGKPKTVSLDSCAAVAHPPRVGGLGVAGLAVVALMAVLNPEVASASFCDGCVQGGGSCPKPVGNLPSNVYPIIVSSPLGPLMGQGPYQLILHNESGEPTPEGTVVWVETSPHTPLVGGLVGANHCNGAECGNPADYPYDEQSADATGTVSYTVGFSGHGAYAIEFEYECPVEDPEDCTGPGYYGPFGGNEIRSTDMAGSPATDPADGDTDQDDKLNLGRRIKNATASSHYDYNLDGVVDGADYLLVANEYFREHDTRAPAPCGRTSGFFAEDTNAPGAITSLAKAPGTGNVITLRWTAPGDDTDGSNGQIGMAAEYDLRCSPNPITSSNFASATLVDPPPPSPSMAGTQDQLTVDRCALNAKYWAIKTRDWKGNWSAISNVLYTGANCFSSASHEVSRELPLEFAITSVHLDPAASDATVALAIPVGESISLDVLDIAGRLVTTLFAGELPAGTRTFHWDLRGSSGTPMAQGMYVIRGRQGSKTVTRKVLLNQ